MQDRRHDVTTSSQRAFKIKRLQASRVDIQNICASCCPTTPAPWRPLGPGVPVRQRPPGLRRLSWGVGVPGPYGSGSPDPCSAIAAWEALVKVVCHLCPQDHRAAVQLLDAVTVEEVIKIKRGLRGVARPAPRLAGGGACAPRALELLVHEENQDRHIYALTT